LARRQAGRGDGDAEPHRVAIGDEHDCGPTRLTTDREDGESASEEGMGGIRYLDRLRERLRWVVERGIMVGSRSTRSTTAIYGSFSSDGYAMV